MSTLTIAPTARKLGRKAVVTPSGLELAEGLAFETWIEIGRNILDAQNTSRWWLADWLFYGETEYGRKYVEALEFTGLAYQTLRNLNAIAGAFDLSRRRDKLSLGHHAEVASLEPDEQDLWLDRAEAEEWSRSELREALGDDQRELPSPTTVTMRRLTFQAPEERASRWEQAAEQAGLAFDEWAACALDYVAGRFEDLPGVEAASP